MFKTKYTLEKRRSESTAIRSKYPDRIPVIVDKIDGSTLKDIDKHKFLVPADLTCSQFVYVIRKRIKLDASEAIYIFVNGAPPAASKLMSELYKEGGDPDGFLYIGYGAENTFG